MRQIESSKRTHRGLHLVAWRYFGYSGILQLTVFFAEAKPIVQSILNSVESIITLVKLAVAVVRAIHSPVRCSRT